MPILNNPTLVTFRETQAQAIVTGVACYWLTASMINIAVQEKTMSQKQHPENQPEQPTDMPTLDIDGHRPIAPNTLEIAETLDVDGHRPVEPSHIEVEEILVIDGQRPVTKDELEVEETLDVDGHRPITKSDLPVDETYTLAGERPIATNQPDADPNSDYMD